MLKITSRTLPMALSLVLALALAVPVEAQKSKTSSRAKTSRVTRSKSAVKSAARIKSSFRSRARTSSVSGLKSITRSKSTLRSSSRSGISGRTTFKSITRRSAPVLRVNGASRSKFRTQDPKTKIITRKPTKARITGKSAKRTSNLRSKSVSRLKRAAISNGEVRDNFRTRPGDAKRAEIANSFRTRPDRRAEARRRDRGHHVDHDGFHSGFNHGFHHGYHRGYRDGFFDGHFFAHHHFYGPHRVFGFHFGGFRVFHGHWHFVLVIGSPIVRHHHHYYHYNWWDGRGASLITYERAVEAYPANYRFTPGACVQLVVITRDGTDYAIEIDPRYWDARDPGELYSALWYELEQTGQLQIEDANGAVHIFPAGVIQQIEARACR